MRTAFLIIPFLLMPAVKAQGSDNCATPTPIAGIGTFLYKNASATQGTQGQPVCGLNANRDVWFAWTAPATDQFQLDSCGLATWDTLYAVYAGSACPTGAALACNNNSCGLQSSLTFTATAGAAYVFQIATNGSAAGGSGRFVLTQGGPPPCSTSTGADVIVGEVFDIGNYAAAGVLDAIAIGTDACNIGTANLGWTTSSANHPVIGGNLYRYKIVDGTGRFEQIGMSWLKHGFAAANGSTCCTCQGGGGGGLGVGCSDIYSSGLNGSQGGLGPRWQVNAHTGVFPYPPANPAWSGSTPRRCEYLLTDAEATGGTTRFFGEAHYVTPDDSSAGNQNNNASWRELTCTGTSANWSFAMSGGTHRGVSAIRVWAQIDPTVQLTDVQVAGDGLFVAGSRAYDLGGGQWRYEYALYNMNSDRCAGTFSVPVPTGATITNVGFHGVPYRNGDGPGNVNFSGANWTSAVANGLITWSTETQAVNASANALRWGTTYNFRFDVDAAPANGALAFSLWRGSPDSMNAAAKVPTPASNSGAVCFGDGTGAACPCANSGAAGAGCANSLGTSGLLSASGSVSVSGDTLLLAGSGMPGTSTCLYFQGSAPINGGLGTVFGDGLRCAGGAIRRLGQKTNAAGASSYPGGGDPSVSLVGGASAGDLRVYQVWYRNSDAAFCTSALYNLTNAWEVHWLP